MAFEHRSAFDADVRYTAARLRSDSIPLSDLSVTVDLDDGLLELSPLTLTMARGKLVSDIAIDWRRRPAVTRYDIRLAPTPMAQLLKGFGVAEAGTNGTVKGRIQLTGTGDALHDSLASSSGRIAFVIPRGTFTTRNVQLSELDFGTFIQKMFENKLKEPVQINCGLVAFTVRRGAAAAARWRRSISFRWWTWCWCCWSSSCVTAHVMEFGLEVEVPKVKQQRNTTEELPVVTITRTGELFLNEAPVNINNLAAEYQRRFAGQKAVYVRCDKQTIFDPLAQVISALGEAKLDVKLVTQPDDAGAK